MYVVFFFNDTATTEIYTTDTLFPYTTLFRSPVVGGGEAEVDGRSLDPQPRPRGQRLDGAIGRGVVEQHRLEVAEVLAVERVEAARQVPARLPGDDQGRDGRAGLVGGRFDRFGHRHRRLGAGRSEEHTLNSS